MMTIRRLAVSVTLTVLTIGQAQAAQSGLPWEAPLQTLTNSLTGPVL
ncbi:MAG: TrbC/VirB2 family protein [Geminicoccaceae bacterium]